MMEDTVNKKESEMEPVKIQIHPDNLKELVVGDKKFRSAMDFSLRDSDVEICRKELKETEEVRDASIRNLREMLCNDGQIKYRTDDDYLLRYLRYKKFNVKETYKHLRKFYKTRNENPNLFYLPTNLDRVLNSDVGYLMPYTDENGKVIFIIKLGNWKVDELEFFELMIFFNISSDVVSCNPRSQITGITVFYDLSGVTLRHVAKYSYPRNVRMWAMLIQELYPYRIKSLVFYNMNAVLYAVLMSLRYVLKQKIVDRWILLRDDLKELHKHISPTLLLKEYGGNVEEREYKPYLNRCLLDNLRYIQYENSFIGRKS